jgi:MtN3 and saliva related transmembrane protein
MIDGTRWPELIGYLAAALTTVSFVPQAWYTFRTRDVRGISLGMYSVFAVGVALWLVYGLLLAAWPIVAANAITLTLAIAILVMKLRYHDGSSHLRHRKDQGTPS